jgi:hypothetical protein
VRAYMAAPFVSLNTVQDRAGSEQTPSQIAGKTSANRPPTRPVPQAVLADISIGHNSESAEPALGATRISGGSGETSDGWEAAPRVPIDRRLEGLAWVGPAVWLRAAGDCEQFAAGSGPGLGEDRLEVILDGVLRYEELVCQASCVVW